jgi:hypothetical protein
VCIVVILTQFNVTIWFIITLALELRKTPSQYTILFNDTSKMIYWEIKDFRIDSRGSQWVKTFYRWVYLGLFHLHQKKLLQKYQSQSCIDRSPGFTQNLGGHANEFSPYPKSRLGAPLLQYILTHLTQNKTRKVAPATYNMYSLRLPGSEFRTVPPSKFKPSKLCKFKFPT